MRNSDIEKCLLLMQTGNDTALEKLYQITKKGVFTFVYSFLQNYHDAEDAMQTVYVKIKNGVNGYKKGTNARAWILQIAKNHAINVINKNKREQTVESLPEQSYLDTKLEGGITEVMQRVLSQEENQIVILHVLWGYKHREISKLLNLPTGTVTSKYKRSVKKLQIALKEESL